MALKSTFASGHMEAFVGTLRTRLTASKHSIRNKWYFLSSSNVREYQNMIIIHICNSSWIAAIEPIYLFLCSQWTAKIVVIGENWVHCCVIVHDSNLRRRTAKAGNNHVRERGGIGTASRTPEARVRPSGYHEWSHPQSMRCPRMYPALAHPQSDSLPFLSSLRSPRSPATRTILCNTHPSVGSPAKKQNR